MTLEKKLSVEETIKKLNQWKKGRSEEEIRSIITQMKDPINKLIAEKILLEK